MDKSKEKSRSVLISLIVITHLITAGAAGYYLWHVLKPEERLTAIFSYIQAVSIVGLVLVTTYYAVKTSSLEKEAEENNRLTKDIINENKALNKYNQKTLRQALEAKVNSYAPSIEIRITYKGSFHLPYGSESIQRIQGNVKYQENDRIRVISEITFKNIGKSTAVFSAFSEELPKIVTSYKGWASEGKIPLHISPNEPVNSNFTIDLSIKKLKENKLQTYTFVYSDLFASMSDRYEIKFYYEPIIFHLDGTIAINKKNPLHFATHPKVTRTYTVKNEVLS